MPVETLDRDGLAADAEQSQRLWTRRWAIGWFVLALASFKTIGVLPVAFLAVIVDDVDAATPPADSPSVRLAVGLGVVVAACVNLPLLYRLIARRSVDVRPTLGLVNVPFQKLIVWLGVGIAVFATTSLLFPELSDTSGIGPVEDIYFSWPILLAVVLVAPVFEEVLFRGFLIGAFRAAGGSWLAAASISTLAWIGSHGLGTQLQDYAVLAPLGTLLAAIRVSSGSIFPCILIHALWNLGILLLGVPIS